MKKRYTVRSDKNNGRFDVYDRVENKVSRSYPSSSKRSADSLCKYMNNQDKKIGVVA
ncbi:MULTISPECIES: hypothetical protein [Paenibacillus]|uniref:hypothetical protein n=1 Tax=Paenibacillus TaxID=44249 RepID=UPI0015C3969E|nr:hypothetical protein [Paenibacillus odorifer]